VPDLEFEDIPIYILFVICILSIVSRIALLLP